MNKAIYPILCLILSKTDTTFKQKSYSTIFYNSQKPFDSTSPSWAGPTTLPPPRAPCQLTGGRVLGTPFCSALLLGAKPAPDPLSRAWCSLPATFSHKLLQNSISSHPPPGVLLPTQLRPPGHGAGGAEPWANLLCGQGLAEKLRGALSLTAVRPSTGLGWECWDGKMLNEEEDWSWNAALMPPTIHVGRTGGGTSGSFSVSPSNEVIAMAQRFWTTRIWQWHGWELFC